MYIHQNMVNIRRKPKENLYEMPLRMCQFVQVVLKVCPEFVRIERREGRAILYQIKLS